MDETINFHAAQTLQVGGLRQVDCYKKKNKTFGGARGGKKYGEEKREYSEERGRTDELYKKKVHRRYIKLLHYHRFPPTTDSLIDELRSQLCRQSKLVRCKYKQKLTKLGVTYFYGLPLEKISGNK